MKKNFLKKLASVLSLALVVSTITPAASASAAAAPNLAKRYTNVYEGNGYAYTVKNAKGYTVKWTVSGKGAEYVKLSKKTGASTKLTVDTEGEVAAKNKSVVVKANFYKGGKLVKAAGDAVKVKVSATGLGIVAADADVKLDAIAGGEVVDFNRTITPKNATSVTYWTVTAKDGSVATDATIDGTGNFKADKIGEYTITAVARNAKNGKDIVSATQDVKVVLAITNATQHSDTKLDVTFNADMKDAKAADFKITSDETKRDFAIKEIKVDGSKVTVETFAEINDGKTYTVTYKDAKSQFVATDNKVANIAITPATVPAETKTEIKVLVKDANGVILSENPYGDSKNDTKLDFNIETTAGYTDGSKLFLFKAGDTAKATAKYHTYNYVDGKEVGLLETELTITAVDKNAIGVNEYKYTVAEDGKKPSNWSTATLNDKLAIEDFNRSIFVYLKDNNGDEVTDGYSLSSSNENVLLVNDQGGLEAYVTAVSTGTAYVLVKDTDADKVVLSLPINIVAKRKAASISLDKSSVTFAINTSQNDEIVTATVKDQYGDKITSWTEVLNPEPLSGAPALNAVNGDKITLDVATFNPAGAGTYNYNVKYGSLVATLKVIAKDPAKISSTSISYNTLVGDSKIDLVINNDVTSAKDLTAKVEVLKGGVFNKYATINYYEIKNNTTDSVVATGSSIVLKAATTLGPVATKNIEPGNYTITMTIPQYKWDSATSTVIADGDKTMKVSTGLVVVDTQSRVEVKQVKSTDCDDMADAFEFYYNGKKVDAPNVRAINPSNAIVSGKTTYVKKAYVDVIEGSRTVRVTVEINKSFTVK